ncbi:hypothetical protein GMDG_07216 [Pseudogymnoascus destructans 20631-21]|uniref:Uncharacterized protein n=1 Tax=Pseudogymnoascus destructans (strain ATCC MYA-4855 / 20631-21) TaxID=658429 RepID=L8FW49_PSED2|nr:hypothetical protein GMDG_07216 [Pseudogymnoascus destructans 20631-21]
MSPPNMSTSSSSQSSTTAVGTPRAYHRSSPSLTPELAYKVAAWLETQPPVSTYRPMASIDAVRKHPPPPPRRHARKVSTGYPTSLTTRKSLVVAAAATGRVRNPPRPSLACGS